MPDKNLSNYFYGDEATQFTYFRIPCQLITHPRFKHLSTDSKLLYGMLLDRMSLSIKNEWYDDTLLSAAKDIYSDGSSVALNDLAISEVVDTLAFSLIVNALLIARYGCSVLKISEKEGKE